MPKLNFVVKNSSTLPDDAVFISIGSDHPIIGTMNGAPIQNKKWYKLSDIRSLEFGKIEGGRIFVCYGSGDPKSFTDDSVINPNQSDAYYQCFDKIELTFKEDIHDVADMTAIDFWSIPVNISSMKAGKLVQKLEGLKNGATAEQVFDSLRKLSDPMQSINTRTHLLQAFEKASNPLSPGDKELLLKSPSGTVVDGSRFVRIIGPNSYPAFGIPQQKEPLQPPGLPFTPYNTFEEYFQFLIDHFVKGGEESVAPFKVLGKGGAIAHISGTYSESKAGTDPQYHGQDYDVMAYLDASGNLTLKGTGTVVGEISMYMDKWDLLNPAATYGGNPTFVIKGSRQTAQNDLYAWIWGDFFAGLNIGALGSRVVFEGTLVGDMPSQQWFKLLPKHGLLFDKLWPQLETLDSSGNVVALAPKVTNHWNQWAQVLNPLSDAYNFAYAERFSAPQLGWSFKEVDTLVMEVLPVPKVS